MSNTTSAWPDPFGFYPWPSGEAPHNDTGVQWREPKPKDKKTVVEKVRGVFWDNSTPQPSADMPTRVLSDLTKLLTADVYDDYVLRPELGAYRSARNLTIAAHQQMEKGLPLPRVAPDGNGGIIMEWRNDRGVIKFGCASTGDDADNYIFYMNGELYRTIEATVENLIERLEWLNQ